MRGQPVTGIVPVRHLKLSDAVASQLEALIRSEHFGSDGRLPSERELAEQFGVGRGSMREAIRKLETLGIIVKNHGVGTFAVSPDPNGAATSISLLSAGDVTALELFEVRYAVEPTTAALSAERRTAQDIRKLRALMDRFQGAGVTAEDFVALDYEFHRLIVQSSKNRLLAEMYEHLGPHHAIYSEKVISIPHRRERAYEGHRRILEAVVDAEPGTAKKQALAHLRFAEQDLVSEIAKFHPTPD